MQMRLIKCTQKLQKEMGLKRKDVPEACSSINTLQSWHANLIYIGGKKSVVFVNDKSLFNFIAAGVTRAEIKDLPDLFIGLLECVLNEEGFSKTDIVKLVSPLSNNLITKTDNRSVIASMNDLAYHYEGLILEAGGVHSWQIPSIIKQLNRMPIVSLKYKYAIDVLKESL
jgi:hypothetical protein